VKLAKVPILKSTPNPLITRIKMLVAQESRRQKILLAKHYNSVMIAAPQLISAVSLKWMKWIAAAWWSGLRLLLLRCIQSA
jgi:hypothetical protein